MTACCSSLSVRLNSTFSICLSATSWLVDGIVFLFLVLLVYYLSLVLHSCFRFLLGLRVVSATRGEALWCLRCFKLTSNILQLLCFISYFDIFRQIIISQLHWKRWGLTKIRYWSVHATLPKLGLIAFFTSVWLCQAPVNIELFHMRHFNSFWHKFIEFKQS